MADPKIFAGPRIRRIRTNLSLTQAAMAEELGISPSYLNLIERNQRPLTVQLLIKLSTVYRVDINELQGDASGQTVDQLKEIFSDPLLADEIASDSELVEAADLVPNVSTGLVHLYRAYKEISDKLDDLSLLMSDEEKSVVAAQKRLAIDEVREWLAAHPAYFDEIERSAKALNERIQFENEPLRAFKSFYLEEYGIGVRILPLHTMPDIKIRYDRHSERIFLSERLNEEEAVWELAIELALLGKIPAIAEAIDASNLKNPESQRLLQLELAQYFAGALMMDYDTFHSTAERLRYDIQLLSRRFHMPIRSVMRRLANLRKKDQSGLPFFFLELDAIGNPCAFLPGADFYHPRANLCARLLPSGQSDVPITTRAISLQQSNGDIAEWFLMIHTNYQAGITFEERARKRILILGTKQAHVSNLVYRDAALENKVIQVGLSCRLCELQNCQDRVVPPATRPLSLDLLNRSFASFDFN